MKIEEIPRRQERLVLADMVLRFIRIYKKAAFTTELQVLHAVYFGHLSGRPMTAGRISKQTLTPRTTVLRKLETLIANDFVCRKGSVYCVVERRLMKPTVDLDGLIDVTVAAGVKLAAIKKQASGWQHDHKFVRNGRTTH